MATLEREHFERLVATQVATQRDPNRRLAKEVIEEFMHFAAGYAARYQPTATNQLADERKFREWASLAVAWASQLARYQSPTFRAIVISPDQSKKNDQEDGAGVVYRTMDEIREQLVRRGVPPDQLARALLAQDTHIDTECGPISAQESPRCSSRRTTRVTS